MSNRSNSSATLSPPDEFASSTKQKKKLKNHYDLIVIGAGSGGLSVGLAMHKLGFEVLLIDKSDRAIGGECLNTGCIPSKALIHASRIVHAAKEAERFGIKSDEKADLKKVMAYVDERKEIIRDHENAAYFESLGLDVVLGTARFVSTDTIEVDKQFFTGKKIVIATGSKPRKLEIPGVELVNYYDNENIFEMESLPERLLLIGGGPIAMELGQAFHRLGSKVSIVTQDDMILPKEDPEIAGVLMNQLEKEGIRFYLSSFPQKFTSANEVLIKNKNGEEKLISFDAVLVGIGRDLNFQSLELENAGIETEGEKIKVNPYLQTTTKRVFLSGDIAGNYYFSHGAELHATLLVNNFFSPFRKKISFDNFPWVTFTEPEVATFGLNERQLKEKGIKYEKQSIDFEDDDRAVVGNYRYGKLILYFSKSRIFPGNSKILGGSMVAPHAGEITQELILANSSGIKSGELFNKIYAYPTSGRVIKTMMVNRYSDFLTPFLKKMLHFYFRL